MSMALLRGLRVLPDHLLAPGRRCPQRVDQLATKRSQFSSQMLPRRPLRVTQPQRQSGIRSLPTARCRTTSSTLALTGTCCQMNARRCWSHTARSLCQELPTPQAQHFQVVVFPALSLALAMGQPRRQRQAMRRWPGGVIELCTGRALPALTMLSDSSNSQYLIGFLSSVK